MREEVRYKNKNNSTIMNHPMPRKFLRTPEIEAPIVVLSREDFGRHCWIYYCTVARVGTVWLYFCQLSEICIFGV